MITETINTLFPVINFLKCVVTKVGPYMLHHTLYTVCDTYRYFAGQT